jgi:predicted permease
MSLFAKSRFYLRSLFQKRQLDEQLSEEIRTHVDLATVANVAKGMAPEEARFAALREFGNVAGIQERARDEHGWLWVEQGVQDVRYAFRQLRRSPGFTAVTVLTLAVGIGASTVLFSVLDPVFLRSLPVADPGGLYLAAVEGPSQIGKPFARVHYEEFRKRANALEQVAAMSTWPGYRELAAAAGGSETPVELLTFEVSANYFTALGVSPAAGRLFGEVEERAGSAAVAVISHELWQRRFGGDPAVVGRELLLDGYPVRVIGVADRGFRGALAGARTDLWLPAALSPLIDQNQPWGTEGYLANLPLFNLAVRLRPNVSRQQAETELTAIFRQVLARPDGRHKWQRAPEAGDIAQSRIELQPLGRGYGGVRNWLERPVTLLAGMVGVVLLVACANIAGLLMVRGSARQREFAMRAALGASRRRIVRQILVESLTLAALGGGGALLVAWIGTQALGKVLEMVDLSPDPRIYGFAAGVTLLTGMIFGLLPAWRLSRQDLAQASKRGGEASARLNQGLVIIQIALAFVLCSGAALIVETFRNVAGAATGFRPQQLWLAPLVVDRHATPQRRFEIERQFREACLALPGIREVSLQQGWSLINAGRLKVESVHDIQESARPDGEKITANRVTVGPDFFAVMRIPLRRGTGFKAADSEADSPAVIVLGEFAARRLFGERDPIGQKVKLWRDFEVVGVAADIKVVSLREEPRFVAYLPRQAGPSTLQTSLVLRTDAGSPLALGDLRGLLRQIEPTASVASLVAVEDHLARQVWTERLVAQLASGFALFVLLLACLGLFGLLAFGVVRRTREIGIRLALGASRGGLLELVIREGLLLLGIGSLLGAAATAGLGRFVEALLYGVSATAPWVYLAVGGTLTGATLVACLLPAWRATKVDPMVALRAE